MSENNFKTFFLHYLVLRSLFGRVNLVLRITLLELFLPLVLRIGTIAASFSPFQGEMSEGQRGYFKAKPLNLLLTPFSNFKTLKFNTLSPDVTPLPFRHLPLKRGETGISYKLFFATLLSAPLSAQTLTITDTNTQQGISEVTIIDEKNNFLALSNQIGEATLENWDTTLSLIFQHLSYQNAKANFKQIQQKEYKIELVSKDVALPEMTVQASRIQENYREVSNQLVSISQEEIKNQQAATSADLLQGTGTVYVQKSQMGGGSPIIRGLEANKVLITLDGIRLNNAIYRGGHLQSVITIDPSILEAVEVVFGPGSLVYGSDALGGVMAFATKKPQLSNSEQLQFTGNASTRFASVNLGKTGHLDFNLGGKKWASLSSISYNDFDDLKIGKQRNKEEGNWGLRPYYIDRINNQDGILVDSVLTNDKNYLLRSTGYNQSDFLQKFLFQLKPEQELIFNLQYSTSSNIPRFDRLNDLTDEEDPSSLKFAEWNYGPQKRFLGAVHFTDKIQKPFADEWKTTLAYQAIEESRLKRRIGREWRDNQIETVKIWTLNIDALKAFTPKNKLQYGIEWTQNDVGSIAYEENIFDKTLRNPIETRYPDGENATTSYAAYARYKWLISNKLTISSGLRWGLNNLEAAFQESAPLDIDFTNTKDQNQALTFALGAVYYPKSNSRLAANVSSGFRSPNIDDVGKLFDPSPNAVVVPNASVGPEYSYSAELDWQQKIQNISFQINAYGSLLNDLIRRSPYQIINADGTTQDSIVYNGDLSQVFANTNTGKAQIGGIALRVDWEILDNLTFQNKVHFTNGKDISNNVPLGHIPPVYGQSALEWVIFPQNISKGISTNRMEQKLLFWTDYNLKKDITNYSPNNEDKPDEALPSGTPAWFTLNARYNLRFLEKATASIAVENMLDRHYKPFASGVSGAGRNLLLSLSWDW